MLEVLKRLVCDGNLELVRRDMVIYTWDNVSGIDWENELVIIKPYGVNYDGMKHGELVVVDLMTGNIVDSHYKLSSDMPTHQEIYRDFLSFGGSTHMHFVNYVLLHRWRLIFRHLELLMQITSMETYLAQ